MPRFVIRRYDSGATIAEGEGATLGVVLSLAVQRGVSFEGADFCSQDLSGRNFRGGDFRGAHMRRAILNGSDFTGARLDDADLTEAIAESTTFGNAFMVGANLSYARIGYSSFVGADLRSANFTRANTHEAAFDGAILVGALGFRNNSLKAYLETKGVAVKVEPIAGPSTSEYMVTMRHRSKVVATTIVHSKPSLLTEDAVSIMMDMAANVDNGRGDCFCGCGWVDLDSFLSNTGARTSVGRVAHARAIEASKALRTIFHKKEDYRALFGTQRLRHPVEYGR